jgi:aspartyl-tRNA(Asn)/glutamyl-tRNA(Gln) amidotransferase subunit A
MPSGSFGGVSIDAGIAARVDAYAHQLEKLGATLVAFDAPRSPADNLSSTQGLEFWMTVPGREIDAYHRAWFPQRAADYTSDVDFTLSLLRAGNTVPLDPASGQAAIRTLRAGWETAFSSHRLDLVLQPAAVIPAPKREDAQTKTQSIGDAMVVWDYLGWPVICLPAGRGSDGLPVGVQLAARPGAERLLCRTAITAEQHLPYWQQRPPAV